MYYRFRRGETCQATCSHPIPVQKPFQIIGLDIMDLPITDDQGNKHVVVFQDYFSKWPMVFAVPDQKTNAIVELLTKEVIPFYGASEAVVTDRGTNLLSHLVRDVCSKLGITKLNAQHTIQNIMLWLSNLKAL